MPALRSRTSTHGRNMAGARGLWRATGMTDSDFGKPIVAVANSFTQFVPGHVHLHDLGQLVCREVERAGGVAKEFDTIAVDDGIAMGHAGMLYSLPLARADRRQRRSTWSKRTAPDALVCISKLRQDHAGHADGRPAAQHPRRVRLRRPDGGRQGDLAGRPGAGAGPDRRHGRRRRRHPHRRRGGDDRALRPARPAARARACSPPTA